MIWNIDKNDNKSQQYDIKKTIPTFCKPSFTRGISKLNQSQKIRHRDPTLEVFSKNKSKGIHSVLKISPHPPHNIDGKDFHLILRPFYKGEISSEQNRPYKTGIQF